MSGSSLRSHRGVRCFVCAVVSLSLAAALTACQSSDPVPTAAPQPTTVDGTVPPATAEPTVGPTATPTPVLPKELTICQAEEPNTLFIYGAPSRAARNVLEALYDGPIDVLTYRLQPVLLEKLPALDDGDVRVRTVGVAEGDRVVDANGDVVALRPGVSVVNSDDQSVVFEGGAISMTQVIATFKLRPDLTWSDGAPLTADDSLYSYEVASQLEDLPMRLRLLHEQTQSYEAVDERTVVWTSVPGYRDTFYFQGFYLQNTYAQNFYHPLPRHLWGALDAQQLLSAAEVIQKPVGWGAFVVEEWVQGQSISLVPNPYYFRGTENLPHLDRVTFRFVSSLQQALDMLLQGQCDVITQEVIEREAVHTGSLVTLLDAADRGQVELISAPSSEWEHLDFSIMQAEWLKRPNFFGDVRTRQAVAMCVHRERIAGEALPYGPATVADSYVASDHPLYAGDQLYRYDYNPSEALVRLEAVGWRDGDGDGIREAYGVPGIVDGTPFSVTLLTNSDHLAHQRTSQILVENLAACGIALNVEFLSGSELFADGPEGPVFGRQFDLVLFSWLNDIDAPCWLYLSSGIPGPQNWWATSNNPGYNNPSFDQACQFALDAVFGTDAYVRFHREAQQIFSHDLPVLPLYFVPKLVAVRPGVLDVQLDPTQYQDLWNIEAFDLDPAAILP